MILNPRRTGRSRPWWFLPVLFVILAFQPLNLVAQQSYELTAKPGTTIAGTTKTRSVGTVRVFAVMVEFQVDDNRFTTGNGTFNPDYLANPNIPISIDPIPHDAGYFGAHLDFMANYYRRVSHGKLTIEWKLYPEIIRLSNNMETYAPLGEDGTDNGKLFNLLNDTWTELSKRGGFDFSDFDEDRDAFILFHAGAGRDINFLGTSLDRTPQDIPSLYMSLEAIQQYGNRPGFQGFEIPNKAGGRFRIRNTLILPETESRPGKDITETPFVLQLGINGLLCATMGNHIGLPDLYNTSDGSSAIGRFGLMDGAGFFSYFGLFPPEPSAWEKVHLGWVEPKLINPKTAASYLLPAISLGEPNSVLKIPLSDDEYFLVENRHRDPEGDGILLKVRTPEGALVERRLPVFDDLFGSTMADSLAKLLPAGVLVDVDNFDWSLPGGIDPGDDQRLFTNDDRSLLGGILIWHVDEAVLRSKNYLQGVNNNPKRRGVSLIEADGSQDIGFKTSNPFLSSFTSGTAFDFWWSGNDSRVITASGKEIQLYQNRFGPDTRPPAKSNTGASATFELYGFSDQRVTAQVSIRPTVKTDIIPLQISQRLPAPAVNTTITRDPFPVGLMAYASPTDTLLLAPLPSGIYAIGVGTRNASYQQKLNQVISHQPFLSGGRLYAVEKKGEESSSFGAAAWQYSSDRFDLVWQHSPSGASPGFLSQTSPGTLDFDQTTIRLSTSNGQGLTPSSQGNQRSAELGGRRFELTNNLLQSSDGELRYTPVNINRFPGYVAAFTPESGVKAGALLLNNQEWRILSDRHPESRLLLTSTRQGWPAMIDWDGDGRLDFIGNNYADSKLEGLNQNGASLNGFPLAPPKGIQFNGTPLVVDLDGNGKPSLILTATDSLSMVLLAYDHELRPRQGFPLLVGSLTKSGDIPLNPVFFGKNLYAVAPNGELKGWKFPNAGQAYWPTQYGAFVDGKVTGTMGGTSPISAGESLLVSDETYNWPNPAADRTYIRFMTSKAAKVDIQVISQDGKIVYKNTLNVGANLAQDHAFEVNRLGNGVYFATIKASADGKSESKTIKIAVIR
jgi:hypothetical protein